MAAPSLHPSLPVLNPTKAKHNFPISRGEYKKGTMIPPINQLTTASSSIDNSEQGEEQQDDTRDGMADEEEEDERDGMLDVEHDVA